MDKYRLCSGYIEYWLNEVEEIALVNEDLIKRLYDLSTTSVNYEESCDHISSGFPSLLLSRNFYDGGTKQLLPCSGDQVGPSPEDPVGLSSEATVAVGVLETTFDDIWHEIFRRVPLTQELTTNFQHSRSRRLNFILSSQTLKKPKLIIYNFMHNKSRHPSTYLILLPCPHTCYFNSLENSYTFDFFSFDVMALYTT